MTRLTPGPAEPGYAHPNGGEGRGHRRRALRRLDAGDRSGPERLGRGAGRPGHLPQRHRLDPHDVPEHAGSPRAAGRARQVAREAPALAGRLANRGTRARDDRDVHADRRHRPGDVGSPHRAGQGDGGQRPRGGRRGPFWRPRGRPDRVRDRGRPGFRRRARERRSDPGEVGLRRRRAGLDRGAEAGPREGAPSAGRDRLHVGLLERHPRRRHGDDRHPGGRDPHPLGRRGRPHDADGDGPRRIHPRHRRGPPSQLSRGPCPVPRLDPGRAPRRWRDDLRPRRRTRVADAGLLSEADGAGVGAARRCPALQAPRHRTGHRGRGRAGNPDCGAARGDRPRPHRLRGLARAARRRALRLVVPVGALPQARALRAALPRLGERARRRPGRARHADARRLALGGLEQGSPGPLVR